MGIRAGRLRHRVDIQERIETQDPTTGESVVTWSTIWEAVPAAVEPLSAREFIAAQATQSQVVARITLRFRAGLNAAMRIDHNGTLYNIAGVLADINTGKEFVTLPVSQGVNNG